MKIMKYFRNMLIVFVLVATVGITSGCAVRITKSVADNLYDSYTSSDDKNVGRIAADTVVGTGNDIANYAADAANKIGTSLGNAANDVASKLGSAIGSIAQGDVTVNDIVDSISSAGQSLLDAGEEFVSDTLSDAADGIADTVNKYSGLCSSDEEIDGTDESEGFLDCDEIYGPFLCSRVVDGDTFILALSDEDYSDLEIDEEEENVRFRLVGIDTPESVAPEESRKTNTEQGSVASDYTKSLLQDQYIYLEYDIQHVDIYGRQLVYAYLDDAVHTRVQDILLSKGYAQTMTIQPNSLYADHFAVLQHAAAEAGEGFWGEGFFVEE